MGMTKAAESWRVLSNRTLSSLPEVQVREILEDDRYFPVRGGGYSLGVLRGGIVVGWIDVQKLGFQDAKLWIAAVEAEKKTKWRMQILMPVPGQEERVWRDVHPVGKPPYEYDTEEEAKMILRNCYPGCGPDEVRVMEVSS